MRITVRVIPRSKRNSIEWAAGALRVHLTAPPIDGAANDALLALLAECLNLPRRNINLISGATSRQKIVEFNGITPAELEQTLAPETKP